MSDGGGRAGGHEHDHAGELRPGWSRPNPEHVPRPTYWPAVLAFGITFLLWGIITTYIILAIGVVLMAIAIGGWSGSTVDRIRRHAAKGIPVGPEKVRHCAALRRGRAPLALALGAVLGLAVVLLVLVALGLLRDADLSLARGAHALAAPWLTRLLWAVSWLGWQPQVAILGVGITGALFWRRLVLESGFTLLALVAGTPIYLFLTLLGFRPRPVQALGGFPGDQILGGTSFPSGHVISYTLFCGFLAYLAYTLARRTGTRLGGVALALALLLLVGPSRVYLGQHWFSDVLASYLLGAALLVAVLVAYRAAKRRQLARIPAPAVAALRRADD